MCSVLCVRYLLSIINNNNNNNNIKRVLNKNVIIMSRLCDVMIMNLVGLPRMVVMNRNVTDK
jgi:hypothetical protein